MNYTANDVKTLRDSTGAGLLDCKKALNDTNGDIAAAEKLLKEKGLAAMAQRTDRTAAEGRIVVKQDGNRIAMVETLCETDFVSNNADFIAVAEKAAEITLEKNLGGIKEMKELPGALFIIDTHKEQIAVAEARRMGIPIIAVVDTNCNPEGIDYPIPGNDDAIRAISLFTSIIANAVIESDNENGLKILENLDADDESIVTDASNKGEDEEIVDYSNYQPTETKASDNDADDKDSLVDEDKLYK